MLDLDPFLRIGSSLWLWPIRRTGAATMAAVAAGRDGRVGEGEECGQTTATTVQRLRHGFIAVNVTEQVIRVSPVAWSRGA